MTGRELPPGFPIPKETRPWNCRRQEPSCTRSKPCHSCRGARNRRSGMAKQRQARKALEAVTGTHAARFAGQLGNEESWSGLPLRVEVKSGAQVGPIWTRYSSAEEQAEQNHAIGDPRPFVMVAMGQRTSDGLFICRLSELARCVEALINQ
jgi:hypothetical protein